MTTAAAPGASQRLRRHATKATASAEAAPQRASLADQLGGSSSTKNVIVLGGSYGGMHAASVLANRLPPSHRVILIERNSHFNHLYVFPRFSVLPGHEHKAFIPYTAIFKDAPKRRQQRAAAATTAEATASTSSRPQPSSSGRSDLLGMGSMSGGVKTLKSKSSTASTDSDRSSDDGRLTSSSRFGDRSSISRSSSVDHDDPLFDQRLRVSRGDVSDSYSVASSYRSTSSDHNAAWTEDAKEAERAKMLAGSEGVVQAAVQEGIASRAQEDLGRPEMEVQELSSALDKGISLDEADGAAGPASTSGAGQSETFDESSPHLVLQASVESITPSHVIVRSVPDDRPSAQAKRNHNLWSIDSVSIPYSHLIYALGSHLPDPLRTEKRFKQSGVQWMQEMQQRVKDSHEIVLVGGGALGVEFATDIKGVYPDKSVTLIHSRKQLLPNFDAQVHELALQRLNELGVQTVLGERLALTEGCPRGSTVRPEDKDKVQSTSSAGEVCPAIPTEGEGEVARKQGVCLGNGRKLVKTTGGKQFECDLLLLCTGQQPNSEIMAKLSPTSVDSNTRLVRVMQTLQVKVPDPHGTLAQMPFDPRPPCGDCDCFLDKKAAGGLDDVDGSASSPNSLHRSGGDTCLSNVYAIGDVADAFGALNAGYQAWTMADVATENVLRDIEAKGKPVELQPFTPAPNLLKLSLGLGQKVVQNAPNEKSNGRPVVELCEDEEDLAVEGVWKFMAGLSTDDMYI